MRIRRVVHLYFSEWRPLDIGLSIAYSLLLSGSIRRDTIVIIDAPYMGVETRLVVTTRVRHLRMDADSLRGFVEKAVRGYMHGVRVERPSRVSYKICLTCLRVDSDSVVERVDFIAPRAGLGRITIVGGDEEGGTYTCKHLIAFRLCAGLPVWLSAGVLQLLVDRVFARGGRD